MTRPLVSLLFLFCIIGLPATQARIVYVNPAALGGGNNGTSWANAYTDLSTAILNLANNDTVWIAAGTYVPSNTGDREASFLFDQAKNLWIYGGFAGTETSLSQRNVAANPTILSGDRGAVGNNTDNCYNVVTIATPSTVTLRFHDLVIRDGNADDNNINIANRKYVGGGVVVISATEDPKAEFYFCEIAQNNAAFGGGVAVRRSDAELLLYGCWIHDNTVSSSYNEFQSIGRLELYSCLVDSRRSPGNIIGQVENAGGYFLARHSTFLLSNTQYIFSGALNSATALIEDCIIWGGQSNNSVGETVIRVVTTLSPRSSVQVDRTMFTNWSADQANVVSISSTGFTGNPAFVNPTGQTPADFQLRACSDAVDAGVGAGTYPAGYPTVDFYGQNRYFNGASDLGFAELQTVGSPSNITAQSVSVVKTTCPQPGFRLTANVTGASGSPTITWFYLVINPFMNDTNEVSLNLTGTTAFIDSAFVAMAPPQIQPIRVIYKAEDGCRTATLSQPVVLPGNFPIVNDTIQILPQAQRVNACEGDVVALVASYQSSGTTTTTTRWFGPNLGAGSVGDTLRLSGVRPAASGVYYFTVSNSCGTSRSANITLAVTATAEVLTLAQQGNELVTTDTLDVYNYYLNGSLVATQERSTNPNAHRYTPTQAGSYYVEAREGNINACVLTSPAVTFSPTSIGAAQLLPSLTLAPNPAAAAVQLLGLAAPAHYALVNALGQTVQTGTAQPNTALTLDATLAPGVYTLQVTGYAPQRLLIAR